jgi:hypothetical protein
VALTQYAFNALRQFAPCTLVSLGYPDLLIRDEFDCPEVENIDFLKRNHAWKGKIYETDAVFKKLGIEATYADAWNHKGVTAQIDLNASNPTPEVPYDVVLDPGTLEHCFNIGRAFVNVRELCNPGGHIIHINPATFINHGFWNLCPTAYYDWYGCHDDEIIGAAWFHGERIGSLEPFNRVALAELAWNLIVVRRSDVPTLSRGWPIQKKYRKEKAT